MNTPLLRHMIAAGAITDVCVRATSGGYILTVQIGPNDVVLEAQRGGARIFRSLDAAARFVHGVGAGKFDVDLSKFSASRALM